MQAFVLLNPYANRWRAGAQREALEAALQAAGIPYTLAVSERRRQAIELVAEAVRQGHTPILAAGGDGTIGEVVNGIARAKGPEAPWPPLGVFPLGTANDLVDNLGLPHDLNACAQLVAAGHTRSMDVVQIEVTNAQAEQGVYYSVNNSALGLEPTITHIQQEMVWAKGTLRYVLAALRGIGRNPHWQARLRWEGGAYEGPLSLVSVGNHPRTGGVFYMTPHADGFDGRLTFVYAYAKNRRRMLQLLPKTFHTDERSFIYQPEAREIHSPWLEVELDPPSPFHADGELYELQAVRLTFRVLPARLPVFLPSSPDLAG